MNREELIQRIYDLHGQAKKTDFGEYLISSVQLEGHLRKLDYDNLAAIERFYKSLLEPDNN